ncbi:hypothetical protein BpHYR1_001500 [Brachionus plicatilis]|uniref:Uncharacterized protein n=1 Tax=Brachionus plicatilis TaxID=10195 RepID=A0A3M7QCP9_BRAPC|nr:hypothetical protein BpHYR1_001500 [Brachionus plicatilis]
MRTSQLIFSCLIHSLSRFSLNYLVYINVFGAIICFRFVLCNKSNENFKEKKISNRKLIIFLAFIKFFNGFGHLKILIRRVNSLIVIRWTEKYSITFTANNNRNKDYLYN